MNKNIFFAGLGGLIIGLIIGFFAANQLNKQTSQFGNTTATNTSEINPQVNNMVVRDQNSTGSARMPEIAETLDKAQSEPNNFEAQISAGDLYLKIQNFTKALDFYEIAHKLKPENYDTIVKIGNTYFDSTQFETAETWYAKALAIKPDDAGVRTDYGITFVERPNPDLARAIKEFQTSLQTAPKNEPTLYNLGVAYVKTGDTEQAKNIGQKLDEVNPQSPLTKRFREMLQQNN
jgi:tetratricopeptide (TPR) repeat protein